MRGNAAKTFEVGSLKIPFSPLRSAYGGDQEGVFAMTPCRKKARRPPCQGDKIQELQKTRASSALMVPSLRCISTKLLVWDLQT